MLKDKEELYTIVHLLRDKSFISDLKEEWFFNQDFKKLFQLLQRPNVLTQSDIFSTYKAVGVSDKSLETLVTTHREPHHLQEDIAALESIYSDRSEEDHLTRMLKSRKENPAHSEQEVMSFYDMRQNKKTKTEIDLPEAMENFRDWIENTNPEEPLMTGLKALDHAFGGFKKGNVYVFGARPGSGKTAFGCYLTHKFVMEEKKKVLFVSMEMSAGQIINRLVSIGLGVGSRFLKPNLKGVDQNSLNRLYGLMGTYSQLSLRTISDVHTVEGISLHCLKYKPDFLVIDYVQLLESAESDRVSTTDKFKKIMKGIKSMAQRHNVPILALAQLNRGAENEPKLSDLKDSGWIEQTADAVFLLSRVKLEKDEERIDLILAKNREHGDYFDCHPTFDKGKYTL